MDFIVAALETSKVELKVEAPVTFKVDAIVAALETFKVDFIVTALVTASVESNIAAFLRYNSPLKEASPPMVTLPFIEVSP